METIQTLETYVGAAQTEMLELTKDISELGYLKTEQAELLSLVRRKMLVTTPEEMLVCIFDEIRFYKEKSEKMEALSLASRAVLTGARKELVTAQQELETAQQQLGAAKDELLTAQQEVASMKQELETIKKELATAQEDLDTAGTDHANTLLELLRVKSELQTAQQDNAILRQELRDTARDLADAEQELALIRMSELSAIERCESDSE